MLIQRLINQKIFKGVLCCLLRPRYAMTIGCLALVPFAVFSAQSSSSLPPTEYSFSSTQFTVIAVCIAIVFLMGLWVLRSLQNKIKTLLEKNAELEASNLELKEQEQGRKALEYDVEERNLELEVALRELTEANQELKRLSAIDALTGLMNRRYFDKRLLAETRRSRREQRPLSLAMLDIDFFKKVNDQYGHIAGDEALRVFSKVLQAHVKRPTDTICRFGGEEFVIILPATQLQDAKALMEKVRRAVEATMISVDGISFSITVSIGLTSRIMADDDEQSLILDIADKLLYEAKSSGRNQVVVQNS